MKFSILTDVTASSINACKVEERDSNSLQNGKPSHFNRILKENRSKTILDWITESCSFPLALEDRN
ncbi:MAG TPA: hypothetical protein VN278_04990 [Methanosarcina sp.]|nr:hypothetical protein [Methanosarcina sp.]